MSIAFSPVIMGEIFMLLITSEPDCNLSHLFKQIRVLHFYSSGIFLISTQTFYKFSDLKENPLFIDDTSTFGSHPLLLSLLRPKLLDRVSVLMVTNYSPIVVSGS